MVGYPSTANALRDILQQMDASSRKLEELVMSEQEAVRRFDTAALIELANVRQTCHQELQNLEMQCRKLVPDEISLETYIDICPRDDAVSLQAFRRKLYQRLANLHEESEDNCLRLRAAYDVTSGVLQSIGMLEAKNTYSPGGSL